MSPLDVLKSIIENIPIGYQNPWEDHNPRLEKVLRGLTQAEVTAYEELWQLEGALRKSLNDSLRLIRLFESKRFLFHDSIRMSSEREETAESRGRSLRVRRTTDGNPILVEGPDG